MKKFTGIMAFFLAVSGFSTAQNTDTLHLSAYARVMVFDRAAAADKLGEWAEANGGYFTWKSEESIRIRVPDEKAVLFREYLENISEVVIEYNQSAYDLREELMSSRSALEAREEILAKNLSYLSSSDVEGTLELEREIRRLMSEIDGYRGLLRRLEHDRSMALIEVSLSFRQQTIPDRLPSSFAWINEMDFYRFINAPFAGGRVSGPGPAPVSLPEGFALIEKSPVYRSISPEGVRLRVRKTENYPEQTVAFWDRALDTDLLNRGYISVNSEQKTEWGGPSPFTVSLWALPLGNEDYLYLTGLRLNKGKLEILEMSGKAEYMLRYLD